MSGIISVGNEATEDGCIDQVEFQFKTRVCSNKGTTTEGRPYVRYTKLIEFESKNGKNHIWLNGNDIRTNSSDYSIETEILIVSKNNGRLV